MIPIKAYKNYWKSIQTRLPLIKHVLFVYHEEDMSAKIRNIKAQEIMLVVLIPSSDSIQADMDNLSDATSGLIYVVEKIDNRTGTTIVEEDVMERTQDLLKAVKYLMHQDATTCGNYMHEYLKGTNFNKLHIDPEDNYLGSYGWSMSFYISDPFFTYDEDEFTEEYALPPVTITDGNNVYEKQSGESYTCQFGNNPALVIDGGVEHEVLPGDEYTCTPPEDGSVVNSDESFSLNVPSGQVVQLNDVNFTDSDGTVTTVPACKDIVSTPHQGADVENSDGSYTEHIGDGGTLTLQDIQVKNSEATVLATSPAVKEVTLGDITVTKYDGSTYTHPAGKNLTESTTKRISAQFPATYDDNLTLTADSFSAGTYTYADLTNVATVAYEKNGQAAALPITLAANDTLKITITRTNAANPAAVLLR